MMQMKKITLDRSTIHGAISLEVQGGKIKPWRIPYEEKDLYYPNGLDGKAEMPAGVRISFISNTTKFELQYESNADLLQFDVLIDGQLYHTYELGYGQSSLTVTDMSSEPKKIDIYLFQRRVLSLKHLWIERAANWEPYTSNQKKWITYGSSITQCGEAESPSQTWPVITAKNLDLDLTCLGFGGQCHFEPMLARLIRDTPADFISLCAGINSYGSGTYNKRSFIPTLVGFIRILREKHHQIPIVLMSPIFGVEKENRQNDVGFTLTEMRAEVEQAVTLLKNMGDQHLHYIDGLQIIGENEAHLLPDRLHPNAAGYKLMGQRLTEKFKPFIFE